MFRPILLIGLFIFYTALSLYDGSCKIDLLLVFVCVVKKMSVSVYMKNKEQGFSLVELIVTMIVLALLAGVAVPSFINTIQNTRATSLANSFVTTLNYARSEAIKRNRQINLCPGTNASTCNGNWTAGWMVTIDGTTTVLRTFDAPDNGATITLSVASVGFDGRGILADDSSAAVFKTRYRSCPDEEARVITVSVAGQVSIARESC